MNDSHELSRSQLAARHAVAKELPTFSGNPEEWPLFIATYESTTRMCGFSEEENLLRLQRSLRGKALDAVRSHLLYPAGLDGVINTLRTLYGRPEVIVNSLVCKIREMELDRFRCRSPEYVRYDRSLWVERASMQRGTSSRTCRETAANCQA